VNLAHLAIGVIAASLAVHVTMLGGASLAPLRRRRRTHRTSTSRRRFSILKPLAGEDDDLALNLESFAQISHPDFEILFGVASPGDPACRAAREILRRYPMLRARLVITDPHAAVNPKVAQLIGLAAEASGDVLVISDSNVRVEPDYLDGLAHELDAEANVGLVTNLFVGTGEASFGAALENLQLCAYVAPAVAASAIFSRRSLTVGKSMAVSRSALDRIGGFEALGAVLAEDHLLGRLVHEAGFAVRLAFRAIENRNVSCDVSRALERHTRWAKMRRAIAPLTFALEPLGDPLLISFSALALLPSRLTLLAFALVLPWKILSAYATAWALRGHPLPLRYLPLELARCALNFVCWARACVSRRIVWRGHPFVLGADSTITPAPASRFRRKRA
jgi:ceramide glucosyltransferase